MIIALTEDEIRAKVASVPIWFHQIEVAPGIVTPGADLSAEKLQRLNLPADMTGLRVLDIGAWDGFFSFECERRGAAEVIAIDGNAATGFDVARELLGSRVSFYEMNVYDLTPKAFGQFDVVLCLGLLYHLRHLLLGLDRIRDICRGQLILETAICDSHFVDPSGAPHALESIDPLLVQTPIVQFYPGTELNNDGSNWWSPNVAALHGMLRSVGFEPYQTITYGGRAIVHCLSAALPEPIEWANTATIGNPQVRPTENGLSSAASIAANGQQAEQASPAALRSIGEVVRQQAERVLYLERLVAQHDEQARRALGQRDAQIADLEARAAWLEEQSRAARSALAAVENGRVMRILRRLGRKLGS